MPILSRIKAFIADARDRIRAEYDDLTNVNDDVTIPVVGDTSKKYPPDASIVAGKITPKPDGPRDAA